MASLSFADQPILYHDDSFSKDGLVNADVAKLKDTELILNPDISFDPNKNILWCGTFQLAWNKTIDLVGEKLIFENQPHVVDLLNRESFTSADLDSSSYVAIADFERNNVEDEIREALEKTFNGAASPKLIPGKPQNPGPDDFVAYAYLYKNLIFEHPFLDLAEPLTFQSAKVESFGFKNKDKMISRAELSQISVCDYEHADNFIIKLKTKLPDDELILAKVPPGQTLEATVSRVLKRIDDSKPEYVNAYRDKMAIPKLNFDLWRDFSELDGLVLKPTPAAHIKSNLVIGKAEQLVRFQLNEKGAILKSEAVLAMPGGVAPPEDVPQPHSLIFDRPFLILMKQANSDRPYFAMWVGNASLLVPAK